MKSLHNIKVEFDETAEKFTCSMCEFKHGDMDALKNHMINVHKKDQWNWGLETKAIHICGECNIEFPTKQGLRNHIDSGHMRPCLNELQKEYCVKTKVIALD